MLDRFLMWRYGRRAARSYRRATFMDMPRWWRSERLRLHATDDEGRRQAVLVRSLGQVTCWSGDHENALPCPRCGAAL